MTIRHIAIAAASLCGALLVSPHAQAGDKFETAFEYELGRVAAHETAAAGHYVLGGFFRGHGRPQPHRWRRHHRYRNHHYSHDRHPYYGAQPYRRHRGGHPFYGHQHHRGCGHDAHGGWHH